MTGKAYQGTGVGDHAKGDKDHSLSARIDAAKRYALNPER